MVSLQATEQPGYYERLTENSLKSEKQINQVATVQTVRLLIEDSGGWWWAGVPTVMRSDGDTMGSCPVSYDS